MLAVATERSRWSMIFFGQLRSLNFVVWSCATAAWSPSTPSAPRQRSEDRKVFGFWICEKTNRIIDDPPNTCSKWLLMNVDYILINSGEYNGCISSWKSFILIRSIQFFSAATFFIFKWTSCEVYSAIYDTAVTMLWCDFYKIKKKNINNGNIVKRFEQARNVWCNRIKEYEKLEFSCP